MTKTTHREHAERELASAAESRTQLAELYRAQRRDHDQIGALRLAAKLSLAAAQAHATLATLDAIEHNWQPVSIVVNGALDQHAAEVVVDQLEKARRGAAPIGEGPRRPVRAW